ncbi:hypothetical protein [Sulfurifustis variabilis]|uniref:hypothetical protein n=1 Tax=Sulfurifustis variabilis TaxID=1675686 RepID=UPI000BBAE505|nr:hypothetical protein [Sulfurifustis variabilis]
MRFCIRHWFKLFLATLLAAAPVLPAVAFDNHGGEGSAHVLSAPADMNAAHAHHAPDTQVKSSPCDKYDGCQGQCCAICTHCFTASMTVAVATSPARPVQAPTVRELHDSLLVTFLNRPPQRG